MVVIIYFLKLKILNKYNFKYKKWSLIALIAAILISILYANITSYLCNKYLQEEYYNNLKFALILFIILFTVIKAYFPNYALLKPRLSKIYPVSKIKRYLLDILSDSISIYFISLSMFILIFISFSNIFNVEFGIKLWIILISANILRRIIQFITENKLYFSNIIFIIIVFIAILTGILEYSYPIIQSFFGIDIIKLSLIFIIGFLIEHFLKRETKYNSIIYKKKGIENYIFYLLWKNKSVRISIIIAFTVKITFLLLDIFFYKKTGIHILQPPEHIPYVTEIALFLLISPLLVFTYVFNNTWGFYRNLWFSISSRTHNVKFLIINQLKLIIYPIIIDFVISLIYILLINDFIFIHIINYSISFIVLFIASLYFSIKFPFFVSQTFSFKANTSNIANVSSILLVICIFFVTLRLWVLLIIPVYIMFMLFLIKKSYSSRVEHIFLQLFKK